jgi:hypothetical protein
MTHERLGDTDRELAVLLARLPVTLDLETSARESGALRRARGVRDGSTLFRLALAYGVCGLSERGLAAWAEAAGVAQISNIALRNRLRGAADWLGEIVGEILSARLPGSLEGAGQRRLRLIDATALSAPGSGKTDWRLHVSCRLGKQPCIEQVVLTDGRGSESLRRFDCGPGDVQVVDRGYAKAGDLDDVMQRDSDFIVRIGWNSVRLCIADGMPFDLFAFLDGIPEDAVAEVSLAVALDRGRTQLRPVRLVVKRLSAAAAERSKRRARCKSSKQSKTLQPQTLRAAGFVMLLTSLDASEFSATDILAIYRLRWQIELLFKRLKSLLDLDILPSKQPDLARCRIYAKLIAALLLEEMADIFLDSSPCAEAEEHLFTLAPAAAAA